MISLNTTYYTKKLCADHYKCVRNYEWLKNKPKCIACKKEMNNYLKLDMFCDDCNSSNYSKCIMCKS